MVKKTIYILLFCGVPSEILDRFFGQWGDSETFGETCGRPPKRRNDSLENFIEDTGVGQNPVKLALESLKDLRSQSSQKVPTEPHPPAYLHALIKDSEYQGLKESSAGDFVVVV